MTQGAKTAKKAAAEQDADQATPETVEDEQSAVTPAADETPETEQDGEQGDAGQADGEQQPPTEPGDETVPDPEPEDQQDGEQEPPADPAQKAPSTAQVEPPAGNEQPPAPPELGHTQTDAAAAKVAETKTPLTITDQQNNPVDPDTLFAPGPNGQRICQVRLIRHGTVPPFGRPVRTLLLAAGAHISEAGAQIIVNRIKAEQQHGDTEEKEN